MDAIPKDFLISLRTWDTENVKPMTVSGDEPPSALTTLISRIQNERGGFRNITEDSLREEIAEAEAAGEEREDEESSDGEHGEEPDRMKELMTAKDELMMQIDSAHTYSAYALDFVSLLLSKNDPVQAGSSISDALKGLVGVGTLGADKLEDSRITAEQEDDNKNVVKGWKIQNLNKTVDTILESATRLEKEIEAETKYWEEVLSISNKGWAVCKILNSRQTLGVRFGFSESAPSFKSQSLAALQRNADGTIYLHQGIANIEPSTMRVRIKVDGEDTGSSPVPKLAAADAPIESLILQARNTTFSSELWHELNRESRSLGACDVRAIDDTLTLPLSSTKTIVLDLVPLENSTPDLPQIDDAIAEGICLTLQVLLSYAHRQIHRERTQIPLPISNQKRRTPPCNLLRPLITRLNHQRSIGSLNSLLSSLCSILTSTAITPSPSYKVVHFPQPVPIVNPSVSERTIASLTDRLESRVIFDITPNTTITVLVRTQQRLLPCSTFQVTINDSSPLITTCVPPQALSQIAPIEEYILFAMLCALASFFSSPITETTEDSDISGSGKEGWYQTTQPNVLRKVFNDGRGKQLVFDIRKGKRGTKLRVGWDWMRHDLLGAGSNSRKANSQARNTGEGVYEWSDRSKEENDDMEIEEVVKGLDEIVNMAGSWTE